MLRSVRKPPGNRVATGALSMFHCPGLPLQGRPVGLWAMCLSRSCMAKMDTYVYIPDHENAANFGEGLDWAPKVAHSTDALRKGMGGHVS